MAVLITIMIICLIFAIVNGLICILMALKTKDDVKRDKIIFWMYISLYTILGVNVLLVFIIPFLM